MLWPQNTKMASSNLPNPSTTVKYANHLYKHFLLIILIPITITLTLKFLNTTPQDLLNNFTSVQILCSTFLILLSTTIFLMSRPRTVYLVDYALFKPPSSYRTSLAEFSEHARIVLAPEPKSINFLVKILERSGLGEETCIPPALHYIPPRPEKKFAREEAEMVIFSCMDALFSKTGLKPKDVDILIFNCSVFITVPSPTAMVINKYRLRSNVKSFNLSGMGCSAGLIAVSLAKDLLQNYPNSNVVVISTEILSSCLYLGKERSMLLPNCLFRMGGAALLMSNRSSDRRRAKYRLSHVVRTHRGGDDKSYRCISQEEDPEGNLGMKLSIDLMSVAGDALKTNITTIGPLVLPASEQFLFAISLIKKKLFNPKLKPYIPNFKLAFEHFCIHAGGRAVIDQLQKNLGLTDQQVEASRMTLHRFGNTSSSSLWYELSYTESKGRMKKGDRVWQIAFGSGFKCNSAVWKCNRTINTPVDGPWLDCIDRYPVYIPEVVKF